MNEEELKILRAVVDERGFGSAAKRVHLSQSAVSQAVRRLEGELGVTLLERGRPPTLTDAGLRVYEHANDVLGRRDLLHRQLKALREGGVGIVSLAASQALSREWLPQLVARFVPEHPSAAFQFETLPSRQIIAAVADGRFELGLGPFSRAMAGLTIHPLGKQRMVLYSGRSPRLSRLRKEGVVALSCETLVTSHLDATTATKRRGLLREHFGTAWVVQSLDLRLSLIRQGLAVGYLPASTVAVAGARRELVALDWISFGVIERTFGLFHSSRRALTSIAENFLRVAQSKA